MTRITFYKYAFSTAFALLAVGFSLLLYFSYQDYVHPRHVYGKWIEIGTPKYNTEVLTLNANGVWRNGRFVTTQFDFNGQEITIQTGNGIAIYQLSGTFESPQLKRVNPKMPLQRFIKQGYEHTVDMEGSGSANNRRAVLSQHFKEK
ncbi:DUF2850 domain-containing protein [Vibrio sonorensis]|uniref:DUF2850 domain-containing protein n=1 Tax=Vibrio sonorensis TaxID=1004316 RepID=UPI0008DA2A69|nr:DUF2850 domain-containing protein [Vibrio sonorensis]